MNINHELLQFYIYKKLIKRKAAAEILEECDKRKISVRDYLIAREVITDTTELPARAAYYCMPSIEIDMLDIDDNLRNKFTYAFMKKHKVIPVLEDKNGTIIVATGKPLDCHALSALSAQFTGKYDYILVPPAQIDRYIDSISAVESTKSALSDLNSEKTDQQLTAISEGSSVSSESDVINNPAVRLVDSIIK